jgi:hypothetical protein
LVGGPVEVDEAKSMRTARLICPAAVAGVLVVLAAGCGSGTDVHDPVHGKVYYKGAALSSGTIVFTPDPSRGNRGPLARSDIQPDGSYRLRTEAGDGAGPGWYRITVMSVELPARRAAGQPYAVPRSLLPEKYRDPELAGLVQEVKSGRENRIDLHLD